MSATRDKSQKITFVYSNLHKVFLQDKEAAKSAEVHVTPETDHQPLAIRSSRNVIKAKNRNEAQENSTITIDPYLPVSLLGNRAKRPEVLNREKVTDRLQEKVHHRSLGPQAAAIENLKQNLKNLNSLQERLRFMLTELEGLLK